ncbi:MAG: sulfatase-like hydrolase/transferase [Verrucomicrobiales bacterium]|nr:sulfatase-like hydrolase/transferase [Verrucomicrobiales bacterium]
MRLFGLLGLMALCTSAPSPAAESRPNIVFVLSDDHSYPFLGCYGRGEMKTPNLDRMAAEGMMFRRMFTGAPQCVPSRATIMTGRSPVAARITRFSSPLPRDEITFPEILRQEAGYFVGVCGRSYHLDGSGRAPSATAEVFDEFHLRTFQDRFHFVDATGQENVPAKMNEFFDLRPADQPYFLWVNFSDPHHPWTTGKNPPDPAALEVPDFLPDLPGVRQDLSAYEGEIEHCDGDFQGVLDVVRERAGLENTLVIFMGDNGMAFPSGKGCLRDPGLNVPLLAWWPGVVKPGGDSSALISGEDIAPTCLEAAGLAVPERISGVSFLPLLKGQPFPHERQHIFAERGPHGSATYDLNTPASSVDYGRCVRSARYKLIYNVTPYQRYAPVDSARNPSWTDIVKAHEESALATEFEDLWFAHPRPVYEVYDLEADPAELRNLYGQPGMEEVTQELKTVLQRKMILDFDYLPLPIASDPKSKKKTSGQSSRSQMFQKLDTDGDGRLTPEEFGKNRKPNEAEAWFQARDRNGDGNLDEAEYTASSVPDAPKFQ